MSSLKTPVGKNSAKKKIGIPPIIEPPKVSIDTGGIPDPNAKQIPPANQEWADSKKSEGFTTANNQKGVILKTNNDIDTEKMDKAIASLEHQFNTGVLKGDLQKDIALLKEVRKSM